MSKEKKYQFEPDEEDEIGQALATAKQILRLAADDIAERGLLMTEKDWQGKVLRRGNPSVKLSREATQLIISLRKVRLQEQKRFEKNKKANTNDAISEAEPG